VASYEVTTSDPHGHFSDFLSLGYGHSIVVDSANRGLLLSLCEELRNSELASLLIGSCELSVSNVIEQLEIKKRLNLGNDAERSFIAEHFSEIISSESNLEEIEVSEWQEILSSPSLRLETEDSLVELICRLCHSSATYFALFQFVRFDLVSVSTIQLFVELSREFLDCLNISIWDRICSRLLLPGAEPIQIPFNHSSPLQGIIAQLTARYGGNLHERGIVNVTGSSLENGPFAAHHVANLTDTSEFHSLDQPNQWVCYDFRTMRLRPTYYAFRCWGAADRTKKIEIKNWVIEVSNDHKNWTEIDRHENDVKVPGTTRAHEVHSREFYRFIRIRQHGPGGYGNYLVMVAFEVFGQLR
jgi:hypothetical protein